MSQSLGRAIERLERLKKTLQNTRPFFIDRLTDWIQIAQNTARTVLFAQVPDGVEATHWHSQVDYTIGLIGAQLLGGEASGIVLYLGRQQTTFEGFSEAVGQILTGEVTLTDIEEYVKAGLEGDPAGKPDITDQDRARSPLQTAFLIRKAIQTGKSNRDEKVAEFVNSRLQQETMKQFYPAILDAWREAFSVIAYDELKHWVSRAARAA